MRHKFLLLGDLTSIVTILPHMLPKSSLTNLGLITARRKGKKINPPSSLHVYLTLCASDNATEMDISAYKLSEFYGHIFGSSVDEKNFRRFFGLHATVLVLQHVDYKSNCFCMEIVGALSFP